MDQDRVFKATRALLEPLLVLVASALVTGLLTVPFVPHTLQLEFVLEPIDAGDPQSPPPEPGGTDVAETSRSTTTLVQRVRELALAERVELTDDGRLLLVGVADLKTGAAAVRELLGAEGYRSEKFDTRRVPSLDKLTTRDSRALPAVLTIQAAVFLLVGYWFSRWRVRPRHGGSPPSGFVAASLLGLAAGAVALVLSALLSAGLTALGMPVEEQAWVQELLGSGRSLILLVPWIVLIGPIAEEVFFRRYVLAFVSQELGFPTGLLVSSVLFALTHFNFSGFLIYVVIGGAMAVVYRRTSNLLAPVVGHVTVNAVVVLLSFLSG